MSKTAILELDGKKYEFPVIVGTENEVAIDIDALRSASGAITIDPGYKNSGSCKSEITFLDGEEGILRYRGYSIEDLADKANLDRTYISGVERGVRNITLDSLELIVYALGVSTKDFFLMVTDQIEQPLQ